MLTDRSSFTIEVDGRQQPNVLSPPAAFKDNGDVNNGGILLPQYYGNWADALVSFVRTAAGALTFFAISARTSRLASSAVD